MMSALGPPADLMNSEYTSGPMPPPPTTMTVPRAGPTFVACAPRNAGAASTTANEQRNHFMSSSSLKNRLKDTAMPLGLARSTNLARGLGRLEAVASADRRDLQMERRMTRVSALVDEILGSIMADPDLNQLLTIGMRLPEVGAEPALPVLDLLHCNLRDVFVGTPADRIAFARSMPLSQTREHP